MKKKIEGEDVIVEKAISKIDITFTNEDMNKMVEKVNEIIEYINSWE